MPEGADLVVLVDFAVLAGLRAEHLAGVVQQRDISGRPPDVVDRFATWAVQRLVLALLQQPVRGQPHQAGRAEQVVQQLGRGQQRPQSLQCLADLGHRANVGTDLARRDFVTAPRRSHRRPALPLDPAAGGIVTPEPTSGVADDARCLARTEANVP